MQNIFRQNRQTVSLKRFFEVETGVELWTTGNDKYYGKCLLPKHREESGQSLFIDERRGRFCCKGKCGIEGADISQAGALLWNTTNTQAAQIIASDPQKYGRKQLTRDEEKRDSPNDISKRRWHWQRNLLRFTDRACHTLAKQRGIPTTGIERARDLGLLYLIKSYEGMAWLLTDVKREQAIWRRLDGLPWACGAKAKLLPGCNGKQPIGVIKATSIGTDLPIVIVEGGPDFLAALGYFSDNQGVICMPSSHTDLPTSLTGYPLLFIPHNDEAGHKAYKRWTKEALSWANHFHYTPHLYRHKLPEGIKDFNDWITMNSKLAKTKHMG